MRLRLVTLIIIAAVMAVATAEAADVRFPGLAGRVVDAANLMTAGARDDLDRQLADHEAETSNQLVVVTVPSLQGLSIEDYGRQLGRHWGIGQTGRNNGALLIVAPNARQVRIEVGQGLEETLTDAFAKTIIDRVILPRFRNGEVSAGIVEGADAILRQLKGSPWMGDGADNTGFDAGDGLFIGLWLVFALFIIVGRFRRRRRPRFSPVGHAVAGHPGRDRDDQRVGSSSHGFSGGGGGFGGGGASGGW